jgi:myo-inositol-1(or 4)-monophosphatase
VPTETPGAPHGAGSFKAGDPATLRALAVDLALEAGSLLAKARPTGQSSKSSDTDIVTDADRAAEQLIVGRLRAERPDDSLLAEEGSVHTGTSGNTWVIDPLDGTINFIYGIPHWAVSIGLEGGVRLGVIYDPSRDELFTDESALTPSTQTDLAQSLVATGFSYSAENRARQGAAVARVVPRVRDIRRGGSLALDLAWVASGRLDAMFEDHTHPWDLSAGIAMLEAAGGVARVIGDMVVAAGNEALFRQLEELVLGES